MGHDYAAFQKDSAELVGQPRPLRKQSCTCPVQDLQIELGFAFRSHQAHRGSGRSFRDGLNIPVVCLLRLDIERNIFRRRAGR